MSELADIITAAEQAVATANDIAALDSVRVQYLGKKGRMTGLLKSLGNLPAEERPAAGAEINRAKNTIERAIAERKDGLESSAPVSYTNLTLPPKREV